MTSTEWKHLLYQTNIKHHKCIQLRSTHKKPIASNLETQAWDICSSNLCVCQISVLCGMYCVQRFHSWRWKGCSPAKHAYLWWCHNCCLPCTINIWRQSSREGMVFAVYMLNWLIMFPSRNFSLYFIRTYMGNLFAGVNKVQGKGM